MLDEIIEDFQGSAEHSLVALQRDLAKVRTGRANAAMLDGIKIDYYGTPTPLNQVGNVKVPDPRMIAISPWEKTMLQAIERAIISANLGLNPSNDGNIIRIPIPPLTGERRKDLTKQVREMGERAKIAIRNHRRDANEMAKSAEKDGEISEDDLRRGLTRVQNVTDEFVKKVDVIVEKKEQEIMEV